MEDIIAGVDLGSSKFLVLIGETSPDGNLNIVGVGESHIPGAVQRGSIMNMEKAEEALRTAIYNAEKMAQMRVRSIVVGIGGDHLRSYRSRGVVPIADKEKGVTRLELESAFKAAQALPLTSDTEIVDSSVQEFIIDGQGGIMDPIGMFGTRMELELLLILGFAPSLKNIRRLIERNKLKLENLIVNIIAAGEAVLTPAEKELGVMLIDMGAQTTSIGVWRENKLIDLSVLGYGGELVTRDISAALHLPMEEAEKIKVNYGKALASIVDTQKQIEVLGLGGRESRLLPEKLLAEVIEARLDELLSIIRTHLKESPYWGKLSGGVVLTGGGCQMPGMVELTERVMGLATRIGIPAAQGLGTELLRSPAHATALGILISYLRKTAERDKLFASKKEKKSSLWENIKRLFLKVI